MGAITDQERYAQLIDLWGHARKQVTDDLMAGPGERLPRRRGAAPVAQEDAPARCSSTSTPST